MSSSTLAQRGRTLLALVALVALSGGCAASQPRQTVRLIEGQSQAGRFVSPGAYQAYLEGQLALQRGDPGTAAEAFRQALLLDPDSPYLHTQLAAVELQRQKPQQARYHLDQALALDPTFSEALLLAGRLLWEEDRALAQERFSLCIRSAPGYAPCYLLYAELLEEAGQVQAARGILTKMVSELAGAEAAAGHSQLAQLCLRQVDYACAATQLERSLQQRTELGTLLRLGHVLRARGEQERAIRTLREAFDRSGGDLGVASLLAEVLDQADQGQQVDDLLQVLEDSGQESTAYLSALAELCLELQRPARALALAERLARLGSGVLGQTLRGRALAARGEREAGATLLRQLLPQPGGAAAALGLAEMLLEERRYDEAARALRQGITAHGEQPPLIAVLSRALAFAGKDKDAVQVVRQALRGDPESRALKFTLGAALERAGRWRAAVAVMRGLLERNPKDAAASNFIGYSLVIHGQGQQLDEGARLIRRALYLTPGQGYIIDSLGWLYYKRQEHARARQLLEMAVRLAPREAEVLGHLAEVLAALDQRAEALQLLRQALDLSEDPRLSAALEGRLQALEKGRVGTR